MEKQSLTYYLQDLQNKYPKEILHIEKPIERDFVFQALGWELDKQANPPVLCARVENYEDIPVVGNLFASRQRISYILGQSRQISRYWQYLERHPIPAIITSSGPVQEEFTTRQINMDFLPLMQAYPTDAARYIPAAIVVIKNPQTGAHSLSLHRLQFKNANTLGINVHMRPHLFYAFEQARQKGENLPATIIVGCHPALMLAAAAQPGLKQNAYDIAGAILQEPLRLLKGRTVDIDYPAEAEVALEGYISTREQEPEGAFAQLTGFADFRSMQSPFHCTGLAHRHKPIYHITLPGRSKDQLNLGHMLCETAMLARLQEKIPWVNDLSYPISGGEMQAYIQMKPAPAGMAKAAINMLMGLDPSIKLAVAVDMDIDIRREEEVLRAVATRVRYGVDSFLVHNAFSTSFDPISQQYTVTKCGIDATLSEKARKDIILCRPAGKDMAKAKMILSQYNR